MTTMDELNGAMAVIGGVVGALLVFSTMILGGLYLIKWLKLPQEMPEGAHYSPPAPPLRAATGPGAPRLIAALQERRRALYARAHAIRTTATAPADEIRIAAADACIAATTLDEAALSAAEATLAGIER